MTVTKRQLATSNQEKPAKHQKQQCKTKTSKAKTDKQEQKQQQPASKNTRKT